MTPPAKFPVTVAGPRGTTAQIDRRIAKRGGYTFYQVVYRLDGKRQQINRSDYAKAYGQAQAACNLMANAEPTTLTLHGDDLFAYRRAIAHAVALGMPLDEACRTLLDCLTILAGRITPLEVCREWSARNAANLVKITVADAKTKLALELVSENKSNDRKKQIAAALGHFANHFTGDVDTITADQVSRYLAGLKFSERTKKNHRDMLGFFNRWLCLRQHLPKGMNWLDGVQNYSARKLSAIEIYTPKEVTKLLAHAKDMTAFIAIAAFAGVRHAEICRLNWDEIDLADGFIEVAASKSKTGERRLVPIAANLKAWLESVAKQSGPVVPHRHTNKPIERIAADSGVKWIRNALRHSCISYRVAQCADVARVADESGNSPAIIRQHYLRRVKPAQAVEWFGIMPEGKVKESDT